MKFMKNNHCPAPTRRQTAFTLLEALVVMVLIGVLVSLVASFVIKSGKDKAASIQCISQLRNLGVLILCYQTENNGEFPPANAFFFNKSWKGTWYAPTSGSGGLSDDLDALQRLAVCPKNRHVSMEEAEKEYPSKYGWPYLANYNLMPTSGYRLRRVQGISTPSQKILLMDPIKESGWTIGFGWFPPDTGIPFTSEPHEGLSNILWADGHVTASKLKDIKFSDIYIND